MHNVLALLLSVSAYAADYAPPAPFSSEVYKARRQALREKLGDGIAVLHARGEDKGDGYVQDANFLYLTGVTEPGAVLVLTPNERTHKEHLYLTPRDPESERWGDYDRLPLGEELRKRTGFEKVGRTSWLNGHMLRFVDKAKTLHVINGSGGLDGPAPKEQELYGKLQGRVPGLSTKDRRDLLPAMRAVKEARELERMEKAVEITLAAHRAAARVVRGGGQENELEAVIDMTFKKGGATRPAFPSIVGSGPNSCLLHYRRHDQTIPKGSLVVVDIGAEYGGYASDVTRTYPADGAFDAEQRKVYETVLRAQSEAAALLKPGVYWEDVQKKADEVIRAAGYGDYFIHGLGHFVGLEVHDAGHYNRPLEPGMVLTIEPGIYIPDKQLGVRIEDMYLVTKDGHRKLTETLPSAPGDVEKMMRGR